MGLPWENLFQQGHLRWVIEGRSQADWANAFCCGPRMQCK
jgi:hypothetical protein